MANASARAAQDDQRGVIKYDNGLIDSVMLQQLQDQFCRANNLYLVDRKSVGRERVCYTV